MWWFTLISVLVLIEEGFSAVSRGTHGKSDIGVFYRTAVLLAHGVGGVLYAGHDVVSGWYRCIPPAGMMWFAPLAFLSPQSASFAWVAFNLAMAVVGSLALRAFMEALEHEGDSSARVALPFAVGLFFLMAAPSLEVGQYSLMFVTIWLVALWCVVRHKFEGAALLLALPASIKIYPVLLLLAPLGVLQVRKWPRFIAVFALGCAFWTWGVPSLFYGARTEQLENAFWHYVVLSPKGRLSESQNVDASSNHGIDAVMLRFVSNAPEPLGAPPHLNVPPREVLACVNGLRGLLVMLSLGIWWRRGHRTNEDTRLWLDSAALWSATLFLLLPGAKARYAVYAFIAFVPLVLRAAAWFQCRAPQRWWYVAFVAVLGVLVMSLVPTEARLWGAGFWGTLILWLENGRLLLQTQAEAPQPLSSRPEVPFTLPRRAKT